MARDAEAGSDDQHRGRRSLLYISHAPAQRSALRRTAGRYILAHSIIPGVDPLHARNGSAG